MKKLSSHQELYEYLIFLALVLKQRGSMQLSEIIESASQHVSTIPATEFIGESMLALKQILRKENGVLTDQERKDARNVLKQVEKTLKKMGFRKLKGG